MKNLWGTKSEIQPSASQLAIGEGEGKGTPILEDRKRSAGFL